VLASGFGNGDFAVAMERAWQAKDSWNDWGLAARKRILNTYDLHPAQTLLNLIS
jgi:hypothetical protein